MNRIGPLILLLLVVATAGCRLRHNDYSDFRTFDNADWAYADSLEFVPQLEDSVADGHLGVCVRHTDAYHYSNLWVELSWPVNDSVRHTDTLQLQLADDFGKWHGTGSGVSYQYVDTLKQPVRLRRGVPLRLRHIMRIDTLHDIEQVGLIFMPDNN